MYYWNSKLKNTFARWLRNVNLDEIEPGKLEETFQKLHPEGFKERDYPVGVISLKVQDKIVKRLPYINYQDFIEDAVKNNFPIHSAVNIHGELFTVGDENLFNFPAEKYYQKPIEAITIEGGFLWANFEYFEQEFKDGSYLDQLTHKPKSEEKHPVIKLVEGEELFTFSDIQKAWGMDGWSGLNQFIQMLKVIKYDEHINKKNESQKT